MVNANRLTPVKISGDLPSTELKTYCAEQKKNLSTAQNTQIYYRSQLNVDSLK
jgi:hypothetical protein